MTKAQNQRVRDLEHALRGLCDAAEAVLNDERGWQARAGLDRAHDEARSILDERRGS